MMLIQWPTYTLIYSVTARQKTSNHTTHNTNKQQKFLPLYGEQSVHHWVLEGLEVPLAVLLLLSPLLLLTLVLLPPDEGGLATLTCLWRSLGGREVTFPSNTHLWLALCRRSRTTLESISAATFLSLMSDWSPFWDSRSNIKFLLVVCSDSLYAALACVQCINVYACVGKHVGKQVHVCIHNHV